MKPHPRILLLLVLATFLLVTAAGCAQSPAGPGETPVEPQGGDDVMTPASPSQPAGKPGEADVVASTLPRQSEPQAPPENVSQVAAMNNYFATDLYRKLSAKDGNLFFSPYSISMALAMTYAGARGETERQMAETLRFILPQDQLHPAINALDLALADDPEAAPDEAEATFRLEVANALWGQKGTPFLETFLDTLAQNYGAGMQVLDFAADPEASRQTINDWVAEQTEDKILNLLPPGVVSPATRLVLTNAIYFKAQWLNQFQEATTEDKPFYLLDGTQINVPMMTQTASFGYAKGADYVAVELPYRGRDLSMVIFMPAEGKFEQFEKYFTMEIVAKNLHQLKPQSVNLSLPRFSYTAETDLTQTLAEMGMPLAFDAKADFSGMTGSPDLFIGAVLHKAFVAVDEEGTEAAAATGVVMLESALMEEVQVTIDHPFIFLIRDKATGTFLFVGRVLMPEE